MRFLCFCGLNVAERYNSSMSKQTSSVMERRAFLLGSTVCAVAAAQETSALTAVQVIDRIKQNVGIPWRAETVDNIITGGADTPVKGIATTMMATLDVMQRAAAAGKNMVITHESTFYMHQDEVDKLTEDPTYKFKLDFIRKNGMISFHFHDHWHRRSPDGIATGMLRELGWEKNVDPQNVRLFSFPGTPLARLAKEME